MDIQGNELEALRGAERIIQSGNVALIYTETTFVPHYESGVLFAALNSHLNERGFSLFNLYNLHSARFGQLRFGDAIFVSEHAGSIVLMHDGGGFQDATVKALPKIIKGIRAKGLDIVAVPR